MVGRGRARLLHKEWAHLAHFLTARNMSFSLECIGHKAVFQVEYVTLIFLTTALTVQPAPVLLLNELTLLSMLITVSSTAIHWLRSSDHLVRAEDRDIVSSQVSELRAIHKSGKEVPRS